MVSHYHQAWWSWPPVVKRQDRAGCARKPHHERTQMSTPFSQGLTPLSAPATTILTSVIPSLYICAIYLPGVIHHLFFEAGCH